MATGEVLIEIGIVTSVELVDRHLPDRVASAWTVAGVAVALVRHSEVENLLYFHFL